MPQLTAEPAQGTSTLPIVQCTVALDGAPLPPAMQGQLIRALIDNSLSVPDQCTLELRDHDHSLADDGRFSIGKTVSVTIDGTQDGPIFDGEITSLEREYSHELPAVTIVRALDKGHRLHRGRKSKVFVQASPSDAVKTVCDAAGLTAGTVHAIDARQPYIAQVEQSDADFCAGLARTWGRLFFVSKGKYHLIAPPPPGQPITGHADIELDPGMNLRRLLYTMSSGSQVPSVEVRSWSVADKVAVVGTATTPASMATPGVGSTGGSIASAAFGPSRFVASGNRVESQAEATLLAQALLDQLSNAFVEVDGLASGDPKLVAGSSIKLVHCSTKMDGSYFLTSTQHVYDAGGYETRFTAAGTRDRSLLAMVSGGDLDAGRLGEPAATVPGALVGVVSNNDPSSDAQLKPAGVPMVKVKLPDFLNGSGDFESDWLRVCQPGMGADTGMLFLPEVNDEVLVIFERGDFRRGYVLGGVHNGKDKPWPGAELASVVENGKVNRRWLASKKGASLVFQDKAGAESVRLASHDDKLSLELDVAGTTITVDAQGDVTIKAANNGKITLESEGDMSLKGKKIDIEATSGDVNVKGLNVTVEATADATVKGLNTTVTADAALKLSGNAPSELKSAAVLTIQGALVKIN